MLVTGFVMSSFVGIFDIAYANVEFNGEGYSLKILYLHQYFNTPDMSGGTRSYEMARRLVTNGHEVHIITCLRAETVHTTWLSTLEAGINVHWLPVHYDNDMSFWRRMKAFVEFAFKANRKAISIGGDLVFATSTPLTIAIPGIITSKKLKIPMVFEVRDLWPEMPIALGILKNPLLKLLAKKLEKFAYFSSKAVVALSPGMKAGVLATKFPRERVAVIPNSSDCEWFRDARHGCGAKLEAKYPWLKDSPLIIYTGTCGVLNGVVYLAQLAKCTLEESSNIKFLVVGGGAEYDFIKETAIRLGVLNVNFFMLERLPKTDMPLLYKRATFVSSLFVSVKEMESNSANKFFDGLAAGKPMLINYDGWHADLLRENNAGLVLVGKGLDSAARIIIEAVKNPGYMNEMGKNSSILADTFFDREILAQQLEKVLLYAVGKASTSPEVTASGKYIK